MGRIARRRGRGPLITAPTAARKVFPTPAAVRLRGKSPPPPRDPEVSTDFDEKSIQCFNCGRHIEDVDKYTQCPQCSSNNFEGKVIY